MDTTRLPNKNMTKQAEPRGKRLALLSITIM